MYKIWPCTIFNVFRNGSDYHTVAFDLGDQMHRCESDSFLDGRNLSIVTAESLATVITAISIASVRWWAYLPLNHRD